MSGSLCQRIKSLLLCPLWGGAHMDADSRDLYRTEVFPGIKLYSFYGSTMILGAVNERADPTGQGQCIFDTPAPFVTFGVVDAPSGCPIGYAERGQEVMNHVSRSMLLPWGADGISDAWRKLTARDSTGRRH